MWTWETSTLNQMLIMWSVFPLVTIEDPCTDDHKYTLGRDGLIVIKADGNKFFTGSCVVTLRAEDPRYQCSKLCFTVDSFKFQVCNLRLAFYDTGVWNYGSAAPSWVSGKLYTCTVIPFTALHILWDFMCCEVYFMYYWQWKGFHDLQS